MTSYRVISADSHVIEPGDLWLNYIDARFRERAPRLVQLPDEDVFEIEGRGRSALGLSAGAGRDAAEVKRSGRFETDVPRAAWDPSVRLEAIRLDEAEAFGLGVSEWTVQTVHIQLSLAELIFGGVFDRFPGLRVVSAENDIGWIGNFLERMDGRFARKRYLYPHRLTGDLMPSEYFR